MIDGDTYTHIRCGEWMLDHGKILSHDIFSHTVPGKPYVAHEWATQLLMGWLYRFGGLPAIAIFFSWVAAVSLTIFYRLLERLKTPPLVALAYMTTTLLLSFPLLIARPHLFTWLLGAVTFVLLYCSGRIRWLLPPLTCLWANLHGGFILGLALQTIFLIGSLLELKTEQGWRSAIKARHEDVLILLASVAASLCNPFGINAMLLYSIVSSTEINRFNPEWWSPNLQNFWLFRVYLAVLLTALLCSRRRPNWTNLLLLAVFLDASLAHRRHVSLAAMFLLPLWSELQLPQSWRANLEGKLNLFRKDLVYSTWAGMLYLNIIAVTLIASLPMMSKFWPEKLEIHFPASERFPHQAWSWLEEHPQNGRVLNDYNWGAFLIDRTKGELPVFIDGFADKYGEQIYQDYYRIANLDKETDRLLDEYRINWVLFPSDAPLVRYLLATRRWEQLYSDSLASVLIRRDQVLR